MKAAYDIAMDLYGLREVDGPNSNEVISKWLSKKTWLNQDDSKTPWCGIGMAAFFDEAGFPDVVPLQYYRAASWLKFGVHVNIEDRQKYDLLIFSRRGGNHVAFYHNDPIGRNDVVNVLGANQNNEINIRPYAISRIIGCRRFDFENMTV